ncbi:MAG: hypothetical protein R3B53_03365 [Candidatus Paceibacterota bacterium]
MNLKSDILNIIKSGTKAPSGDNLQPWRFEVSGNVISIFHREEILSGPIDRLSEATNVTYGALIENMVIASDHYGYDANVTYFPDESDPWRIADICLVENSEDKGVRLFEYIEKRVTDRRPYQTLSLDSSVLDEISELSQSLENDMRLIVLDNKAKIRIIARLITLQLKITFSNKPFHHEFFGSLRWNKRSAIRTKDGLDAITLELNLAKQFLFRYILGVWPIVNFLNKFGIADLAAKLEESRYMQAGAYIAIVSKNHQPSDYVKAGQLFERLWLVLTRAGLSAQPAFSSILIKQVLDVAPSLFGADEIDLVCDVTEEYREIFAVKDNEHIMCIMRVGKTEGEPRRSFRKEPEVVFKN